MPSEKVNQCLLVNSLSLQTPWPLMLFVIRRHCFSSLSSCLASLQFSQKSQFRWIILFFLRAFVLSAFLARSTSGTTIGLSSPTSLLHTFSSSYPGHPSFFLSSSHLYLFLFFHFSEKYCAFCSACLLHRAFPGRGRVYFLFMVSWLLFGFLSAACAFSISLCPCFSPFPSASLGLPQPLNYSLSFLSFSLIAERISDVFPFASNIDRLEYTRTLYA